MFLPVAEGTNAVPRSRYLALCWAAVAAVILFNTGWFLAGLIQAAPYSAAYHDVSDLGALTARWPWLMLVPQATAGVFIIAFALLGLRPALRVPGRGDPIGAWLVALSLSPYCW
jgi:hypothetical membrane protein